MTHEIQNVACRHALAARMALEAFRLQQPAAGLDWSSLDTATGLLDQTIEELRRPVRNPPPAVLAAGGSPAATANLMQEIQAAGGLNVEFVTISRIGTIHNCSVRPSAS